MTTPTPIQLLEIGSEHRLRSENLPFDIDVWYPSLEKFTFPSIFLPLTRLEAFAIMNYQNTRYNERPHLTPSDIQVLKTLEQRLDEALKQPLFLERGAFMRLCGRSPKDADPLDRTYVRSKYQETLQSLLDSGCPLNANTKLRAIAKVNYLRVTNGKEAMSLLLTSERVFADLHDWIRWGEPEQIVFRQFESDLNLEYEFRAYIHQGRINAISQYDHYTIFPDLEPLKDKLQAMIIESWKEVHHLLGEDSYVMDFAYLPQSDKMKIIEMSPFRTCTGAALFSWSAERHLLENGPLEFRIKKVPHANLEDLVEANWEQRWKEDIPKYWEFYEQYRSSSSSSSSSSPSSSSSVSSSTSRDDNMPSTSLRSFFSKLISPFSTPAHSSSISTTTATPLVNIPSSSSPPASNQTHLLFVYGTLKKGFHWNPKFLSTASFVTAATTRDPFPLVVGESGVPYLLGDLPDQGKQIVGEIWKIDEITLQGLDEYEGVSKGYYSRRTITVFPSCPSTTEEGNQGLEAQVYFKTHSSEELKQNPFLEEYTLEFHKKNYKAIKHIQVKQLIYLGEINNTDKT